MRNRRADYHEISAKLIEHLVVERGVAEDTIAEMLGAETDYVGRVRAGRSQLAGRQVARIADALGLPMGQLVLDAIRPATPPTGDTKRIVDIATRLIHQADAAVMAARTKKAS